MTLSISHQAIQASANTKMMESINKHGLCSLKEIPKDILTNPVLQTQDLDGNICVNYLNLENASTAEIVQAVQVAVFEEYCGVYGISLERQWPFQRFQSKELLHQEMYERLNHSIVFMLRPPTLAKARYSHLPNSVVASYTLTENGNLDGITQSRGRNLLDFSRDSCSRISEIKTTHHFSKIEIKAAFVPERLYEMAKGIFTNIRIISVSSCMKTFKAIPEILKIFHDQALDRDVSVEVPDYYAAITSFINENKIEECSLHAVRLQTQFDFITRSVESVDTVANILKATSATKQHVYLDRSAWATVHKNYGFSKKELLNRVKKAINREHFTKMEKANRQSLALCEGLIKAKGENVLTYLYQSLTQYQIKSLIKIDVKIVEQPFCKILNFKDIVKSQVEKIINTKNQSVIHLQAVYRGFFARKKIKQYQLKAQQLAIAQAEYKEAELSLKRLSCSR